MKLNRRKLFEWLGVAAVAPVVAELPLPAPTAEPIYYTGYTAGETVAGGEMQVWLTESAQVNSILWSKIAENITTNNALLRRLQERRKP
jgi:hypothetical protein